MRRLTLAAVLFIVAAGTLAALPVSTVRLDYKTITLDRSYNHDKYLTRPADIVREFRAYTTSFDGSDDNDGNGTDDIWGIPEWVAFHIKQHASLGAGPSRPKPWLTDPELNAQGLAPKDETYHFSNAWRAANPTSPQLGYDRGAPYVVQGIKCSCDRGVRFRPLSRGGRNDLGARWLIENWSSVAVGEIATPNASCTAIPLKKSIGCCER